nr:MAG TPA: hypothetical protein [Caudoviricetes sp.]
MSWKEFAGHLRDAAWLAKLIWQWIAIAAFYCALLVLPALAVMALAKLVWR